MSRCSWSQCSEVVPMPATLRPTICVYFKGYPQIPQNMLRIDVNEIRLCPACADKIRAKHLLCSEGWKQIKDAALKMGKPPLDRVSAFVVCEEP